MPDTLPLTSWLTAVHFWTSLNKLNYIETIFSQWNSAVQYYSVHTQYGIPGKVWNSTFHFSRSWIVWNSEFWYEKVWNFVSFVESFRAPQSFVCQYIFHAILWKVILIKLNFYKSNINLIIKSKVFPKTTWYIPVFAFSDLV